MASIAANPRWTRFSEFLADRIGLHFPPERQGELVRGMTRAAAEFGFADPENCADWLLTTPLSRPQIEILASSLTIGETYFFREKASFEILATQVLPTLIRERRSSDRRLRFWCAACCTGEEPYSLAILLCRLLPDLADWQITILGTDINPAFLGKAAAGVFREWSFRDVPGWLRERYFRPARQGQYEIRPQIRRMVSFAYLNLAEDVYPSLLTDTQAMDVIFCRNVLMYFAPAQTRKVVAGLRRSLTPGGWLVVSPVEVPLAASDGLIPVTFPEAVFYRRDEQAAGTRRAAGRADDLLPSGPPAPPVDTGGHLLASATPAQTLPTAEAQAGTAIVQSLAPPAMALLRQEACRLHQAGQTSAAIDLLAAGVTGTPRAWEGQFLLARLLADAGRLGEALACCDQALSQNKLNASGHYLRGIILGEQGDRTEAIRAVQKALYLEPDFVLAHFALGNLLRQRGKARESDRAHQTALILLARCSRDDLVPEAEGLTAGRLTEMIQAYMRVVPRDAAGDA